MATPITGAISLADIRTELGLSGAISLNDTSVRQMLNATSGTITVADGRACARIGTTTTNVNVLTGLFGSSSTATTYKVYIPSGVSVGATAGNTAFTLGQFATGSSIIVNNYGNIQAYGGVGGTSTTGGSGGDAINANYANQTVTINNQAGATIYGGGGGGGKGGAGGTGGTGGGGSYTTYTYRYYLSYYGNYNWQRQTTSNKGVTVYRTWGLWNQVTVVDVPYYTTGPLNGYIAGAQRLSGPGYIVNEIGQGSTVNTNGGAGGAGGAGGNGGRGLGYDGAAASGSAGTGGSAGSAGGTNAGAGGTGGTGGTGGSGSTWGTAGASGSTGSTGATGASGNRTAGSAGSGGAAGSAGGAAGRYLVKGANSVTLNNSGTVAGGLA